MLNFQKMLDTLAKKIYLYNVESPSRDQMIMLSSFKQDMENAADLRYESGQDVMKIFMMLENQYNAASTNYMYDEYKANAVFKISLLLSVYQVVLCKL